MNTEGRAKDFVVIHAGNTWVEMTFVAVEMQMRKYARGITVMAYHCVSVSRLSFLE